MTQGRNLAPPATAGAQVGVGQNVAVAEPTVLLIESDSTASSGLARLLEQSGYRVAAIAENVASKHAPADDWSCRRMGSGSGNVGATRWLFPATTLTRAVSPAPAFRMMLDVPSGVRARSR